VLGRATKLARYATGGDKTYRATVRLGITTRTLDAEGEVLLQRPVKSSCDEAAVRAVLEGFVGAIAQVPPMYSAKKIDGKKLYTLARQGIEVAREAKTVHVRYLTLISYTAPDIVFDVCCSAGTYVRVLAQDVGEKLGCGAHLLALRRLAAGPFNLEEALTLQAVLDDPAAALKRVLPLSRALAALPHLQVPRELGRMITTGYQLNVADLRALDAPAFVTEDALAVAVDGGPVIAIARAQLDSVDLSGARRDRPALKTERVLGGMQ
jgi:tRNA pseudouridine55 synthase